MSASRSGDLKGALHRLLPLYIRKIQTVQNFVPRLPQGRRSDGSLSRQVGGQLAHIFHRVDHRALRQRGLRRAVRRDIQGFNSRPFGSQSHGQHSGAGADLT